MTGFISCCGFSHGPTSMYAMILGIASYLLAISSTWGCYFATVNFLFVDDSPTQYSDIERMGVGLFSYEDTLAASDLTCRLYSKAQMDSFDTGFKVARTCGIFANILIGLGMIFLICLSCTVVRKSTLRVVGVMLMLGGILEALTFIIYTSDALCKTCEIFFGSGLALLCSVVTMINATMTCRIPEVFFEEDGDVEYGEAGMKSHPMSNTGSSDGSEDDQSVTVSDVAHSGSYDTPVIQIQEYNGRRQIVKTIVNPDGSRAVEETTIMAESDLPGDEI